MMALQTCKRCRKRRIKCDLKLPACGNCSLADVECVFFDDSLQQEFPRSYLHALQGKVRQLQDEIEKIENTDHASASKTESEDRSLPPESDYHLDLTSLTERDSISATSYVGPSSTATLVRNVLKGLTEWHIENRPEDSEKSIPPLAVLSEDIGEIRVESCFPLSLDHRKFELSSAVPPSTQRTLIEHYLKIIQPKYPLLTPGQEAKLVELENPLKWSIGHIEHPDSLFMIAVFAISTALVARDIDSNLSAVASLLKDMFQRLNQKTTSGDQVTLQQSKQMILSLCFLSIYEQINPVSNQSWELVGRALGCMEQLRAEYHSASMVFDEELQRQELTLLKLESILALHFQRPSPYCETWPTAQFEFTSINQASTDPLHAYIQRLKITQSFSTTPLPSEDHIDTLLSDDLEIDSAIDSAATANISLIAPYFSLHPLYTSLAQKEIFADHPLDDPLHAKYPFKAIANCAICIIDEYARANASHKLISLWLSAERVLEAGIVWVYYLIYQRRGYFVYEGDHDGVGQPFKATAAAIDPLLTCAALMTSFAERWSEGKVYNQIWENIVSLLWAILE